MPAPVAVTTPRPCPADTVVALKAMHFLSPRPDASATACRFLLMGTDSPVSIASCTCANNTRKTYTDRHARQTHQSVHTHTHTLQCNRQRPVEKLLALPQNSSRARVPAQHPCSELC